MDFTLLTTGEGGLMGLSSLLIFVPLIGIMYFLMIRPQKKKEKQAQELRNSIEIGDEVTTIGGIIGRVVSIKEDTFVIETAGERTRMRFKRWAVQDVGKLSLESEGGSTAEPAAAQATERKGFAGLFGRKKKDGADE